MKNFVFVSGNKYKVAALENFLGKKVDHHDLDLEELQTFDGRKVVEHKAREAYKILKTAVLVDDAAVVYTAMNGLPGTLVKAFLATIGPDGLAKMLNAYDDRSAQAMVVMGYYDGQEMQIFEGVIDGKIATEPRGLKATPHGHGWNSIFVPNGSDKTFAEMNEQEIKKYAPRNFAVKKLKKFLEEA